MCDRASISVGVVLDWNVGHDLHAAADRLLFIYIVQGRTVLYTEFHPTLKNASTRSLRYHLDQSPKEGASRISNLIVSFLREVSVLSFASTAARSRPRY